MRKLLTIFACILFFVLFSKEANATCYYIGNTGYAACAGNVNARRCIDSAGSYYACCNQPGDVCPAEITSPVGEATPIPTSPASDPNCGGISQPCCGGNTCRDSSLTCNPTAAGSFCMFQAQIRQQGTQTGAGNGGVLGGDCELDEIDTAIGCIPLNQSGMMGFILKWAIGVGGGIAFILILVAGFQIMTSAGDPKRLQAGRELLMSAIGGIILLVLSVFILRVIGIDILKLGSSFGQ